MTTPRARSTDWRPVLEGALAKKANQTIHDIADRLHADLDELVRNKGRSSISDPSLASGLCGPSLFFAYLAKKTGCLADQEMAAALLEVAIANVSRMPMSAALHSGFLGVAWTSDHLDLLLYPPNEDLTPEDSDIDQVLAKHLGRLPWRGHFELMTGLVGLGVYALERPSSSRSSLITSIFSNLQSICEKSAAHSTWHTRAEQLPPWQAAEAPDGHYDLGLAHGVPGVVGFLGRLVQEGYDSPEVRRLLESTVIWLETQLDRAGAEVPAWVKAGISDLPSRSGWCYGEPGIASAILLAASATGRSGYRKRSLKLMHNVAKRNARECGVTDAGFCHGASGLAHMFARFSHATGVSEFTDAAQYWSGLCVNKEAPTTSWHPSARNGLLSANGLLMGNSGLGLSLLSLTTSVEPSWDRCLLLSSAAKI